MRKLLLLVLLSFAVPGQAQEPDIQCPGMNTVEMRWCVSKSRQESRQALKEQLPAETLERWEQATKEACAVAYAPYRHGTIYPQMVVGCHDQLCYAFFEQFSMLQST